MKVITKDILGQLETHIDVEISLIESKGILVLTAPTKDGKLPGSRMVKTYILQNLIYYETLPNPTAECKK